MTPPSGYFATTSTALAPVWVNETAPATGRNFGVLAFQLISLDAARVLSLAPRLRRYAGAVVIAVRSAGRLVDVKET